MIVNKKGLTKNWFLGNKLEILQFAKGYRGTMDSVLIAASVAAKSGQKVLELGCGNGVAMCCLLRRVNDIDAFGIEIDREAVELCRMNLHINNFEATILNANLAERIKEINSLSFDHVFMNPPYFRQGTGKKPTNLSSLTAKVELFKLSQWIAVAKKRCKQKGTITIIQRVERLPEIIESLKDNFGGITVLPLRSFKKSNIKTVIVRATKSSKAPFKLLTARTIHIKSSNGKIYFHSEFKKILECGNGLSLN